MLDTITRIYNETGRFPKKEQLATELNMRPYHVQTALKKLVAQKKIIRTGNFYSLPAPNSSAPSTEKNISLSVLKIVFGVVGLVAFIISVFYSYRWMTEFLPPILAGSFAVIISAFAVAIFEIAVLMWIRKQFIISVALFILFGIVATFSITCTIAGQYDKLHSNNKGDSGGVSFYQLELENAIAERDSTARLLSEFSNLSQQQKMPYTWRKLSDRKEELNQKILSFHSNLSIEKKIAGEKADFYSWLARAVFNTNRDWVEFLLHLFPAVFVDIIAPISIAIFIFLDKKYSESL